jgi:hypothetical protein
MYHPGKLLKIFSPDDENVISSDNGTQALVLMWDDNLTTVQVHKKISTKIKLDDIVLVDYRPVSAAVPVPRMHVTKILSGDLGIKTWNMYKEKYRKMKGKPLSILPIGQSVQTPQNYIG